MGLKQRILVLLCGVTLTAGAANAQVVIHAGPPPGVIVERPGPPLHSGWGGYPDTIAGVGRGTSGSPDAG